MQSKSVYNIPFDGTDALIIKDIFTVKKPRCLVYITDNEQTESLECNINNAIHDVQLRILRGWDCLPYDAISPKKEIMHERLKALNAIIDANGNTIVIVTPYGLMQKVQPAIYSLELQSQPTSFKKNDTLTQENIITKLVELGYTRSNIARYFSEFAVRGSIIDIAISNEYGVRIDLMGNAIDNIKNFDLVTQRSVGHIDDIIIIEPITELFITDELKAHFIKEYRKRFPGNKHQMFEAINSGISASGIETLMPLFYGQLDSLFDYMPQETLIIAKNSVFEVIERAWGNIENAYNARLKDIERTQYPLIKPEELYLTKQNVIDSLNVKDVILFNKPASNELYKQSPLIRNIAKLKEISIVEAMMSTVNSIGATAVVCCSTIGSVERISGILRANHIDNIYCDNWDKVKANCGAKNTVLLTLFTLSDNGFMDGKLALFSEEEIIGMQVNKMQKLKRNSSDDILDSGSLTPGDFIVHAEYGIGLFAGLELIDLGETRREFMKLIYHGDNTLYVPIENIDIITRYGDGDKHVNLDRLGSASWQSRKALLKKKLKEIANELVKMAAMREVANAPILVPNTDLYAQFCSYFPYSETDDQLAAIEDSLADMASGKLMDRLVCGDIGFGKTEVAMRAACAAVFCDEASVQVAIIAPTTLLARQHYINFTKRFEGMPVNIKQLSKFVKPKEAAEVRRQTALGEVDIIIGTTALLAKGVTFKNLALVIIDEEQMFGVAQKEALKKAKYDTHVLALSATPIPRTLHMSLSGLKDLSIISMPPVNRKPVITNILTYFDESTIRDIIMHEYKRGGRVFYIMPLISDIEVTIHKLKAIVPEVAIGVATGKVSATELDSIMNDFYEGKYQLLLSTAIVQSGLDIPAANTIIIDKAEQFGLTQLYQMRGRVGRSNIQGYAYLITRNLKTESSRKRMEAICVCDSLGSGFNIATQDMEIRGFGNILGDEQSGHIKEVGVELYHSMLSAALQEVHSGIIDMDEDWSPTISIGFSAEIPIEYIQDDSLRLSIYRKIARIENENELEQFAAEMIDRFGGPLPLSVQQLICIVKLKQVCKTNKISKVERGPKGVAIYFKIVPNPLYDSIMQYVGQPLNKAKLRGDNSIIIEGMAGVGEEFVVNLIQIINKITSSKI